MPRYKLTIEYCGTNYHGWQYQPGLPTIQGTLESAISNITQLSTRLQVSGRTDTGVHALEQVAHADIDKDIDPFRLRYGINHFLRDSDISVLEVEVVNEDFHARFSTKKRAYIYQIINRHPPLTVDQYRAYRVPKPLDVDLMNEGVRYLLGQHDFTTFRASECQALSPIKTLDKAEFRYVSKDRIEFYTESKSFLHHQVRNMIGTLCLVGLRKWTPLQVKEALEKKDRRAGGPTAPPDGLYLRRIIY